jgi:tripartite-type tricarboxylate transporter receptor subunit TctC
MSLNRKWLGCIAIALSTVATGPALGAESYPNKPGRLILPFGAGGSTDVVDNRAGAGGIIGTEMAARAPTDGHTIFTYGINQAITAGLRDKLPYDHLRDFELISLYAAMPNILTVTPTLPATNTAEFVKLAKANAGKFKYASSGVGASPHLTMEYFKSVVGIDVIHVPYKNSAQGYVDVIAGQVQVMFFNLPGPLPHVKAGRLRALAVSSTKRAEQLPEVPTVIEGGIPDFEVTVWQGYAVPKGTPQTYVAKIHAAMMKALASPDLKQRFFENGVTAEPMTREAFRQFVQAETTKWKKVIALSGAKLE